MAVLHHLAKNRHPFTFGSIWWLLDEVVKKRWMHKTFVPRHDGRHPTLVTAQGTRAGAAELVPILFGRSEAHPDAFIVYEISASRPPTYATHFFDALWPTSAAHMMKTDPVTRQPVASQNPFCPGLDAKEQAELRGWMSERANPPIPGRNP